LNAAAPHNAMALLSLGDPTGAGSRRGHDELLGPEAGSALACNQRIGCSNRRTALPAPSHRFSYWNDIETSNSLRSRIT